MLITMFTDISYCGRTKLAAYAVWAKANGGTFRHADMFKTTLDGSNTAEACAIVNGVYLVIKTMTPEPNSKIIAQTDSAYAIRYLSGADGVRLRTMLNEQAMYIEFRHVKGHKGTLTRRNAVNTWCDRTSRKLLREARLRLDSQEVE